MTCYNAFSWALSQMSQSLCVVSSWKGQEYFVALRPLISSRKVMILQFIWIFLAVRVRVTPFPALYILDRNSSPSRLIIVWVFVFPARGLLSSLDLSVYGVYQFRKIFRHLFKYFCACPLCAILTRLQLYVCQITH